MQITKVSNPYKTFGVYYKPTREEFLHYYQQDLQRIIISLLNKKNLKLTADKIEDFIQEMNLRIAFRKEDSDKPSRLERFDPFRNLKKKKWEEEGIRFNYLTEEDFSQLISFKTYLYTIVKSYVYNKAKQEAANHRKHGLSIDSNPDDIHAFILGDSIENHKSEARQKNVNHYLSEFKKFLEKNMKKGKNNISLIDVWECMQHSTKNKEIVNLLQEKYPDLSIKSSLIARHTRKIKDFAKKFQETSGSIEF